jgi:glycosyltransferase involved in cell wall biosynthesis
VIAEQRSIRVLYSFPHKLGADRISNTAWQLVNATSVAGAEMIVHPGNLFRPLPPSVQVIPTLSRGMLRLPYKLLGKIRTLQLHDYIVSKRIEKLAGQIDIVHTWPVAALRTLRTAARLGIPTVLERPNAYTRFAYEVVEKECVKLGIAMPPGHEHAYHEEILQIEEAEYAAADYLLCPSDFVLTTFLNAGYSPQKLVRHQYGYDPKVYSVDKSRIPGRNGLTMLFVGGVAPRKGLHYALEAWLNSPAHENGTFLIAGEFIEGYAKKLNMMLSHSSVRRLGHRRDVAELMRKSDILVLPSIEEGSALVTSEARGSGCVLLVSEAAGAICAHMDNALVHKVGDVDELTRHITLLDNDRSLLSRLRSSSLNSVDKITWDAAGVRLLNVYRQVMSEKQAKKS